MVASIRSRGISTMLMIQAESQLEEGYGHDAKTIISNCDSNKYANIIYISDDNDSSSPGDRGVDS